MKVNKGLFTDTQPIDQPEEFYRYAENLIVNNRLGALTNELGQSSVHTLTTSTTVLGHIYLSDDSVVLFVRQGNSAYIYKLKNDSVTVILDDLGNNNLAFDIDSRIEGVSRIDHRGNHVVYWTDNINPPRTLNLGRIPTSFDYNSFSLFPFINSAATLSDITINPSGGNLETGVYYFALAYVSEDDVETDYFFISKPIYINDSTDESNPDRYDGASAGLRTSKSITLNIGSVDSEYKALRIAAIPQIGGVFGDVARVDVTLDETTTELSYTYTGLRSKVIESLTNIVVPKAFYERAKAMTSVDNRLYVGNLEGREDIGFQKYANNITLNAETSLLEDAKAPASNNKETMNSYKNPEITITKKGYRRDEVYAFYISFILNNGGESKAYHIPGREAETIKIGEEAEGSITVDQEVIGDYTQTDGNGHFQVDSVPHTNPLEYDIDLLMNDSVVGKISSSFPPEDINTTEELKIAIINGCNSVFASTNTGNGQLEAFDLQHATEERVGIRVLAGDEDFTGTTFNLTGTNPPHTDYLSIDQISIPPVSTTNSPEISVSVNTTVLPSTSIPVDFGTFDISTSAMAEIIRNTLNNHSGFSTHYTAFFTSNVINIIAKNVGSNSNGTLGVSPLDSNSTYSTQNLAGGSGDNYLETASVPVQHEFYSEANNLTSDPKLYQIDSIAGSNGMGYWENKNELYPSSGEDWEVWGSGGQIGSLYGENVRHHKFPEHKYSPVINWTRRHYQVLHISFDNIHIPEEIKDKVKGYKIYYAERTPENKTVLDQSFSSTFIEADNLFGYSIQNSGDAAALTNVTQLTLRPFSLLQSQQDISKVSYLKGMSIPRVAEAESITSIDTFNTYLITHEENLNEFEHDSSPVNTRFLSAVSAISYLPVDTDIVNTSRLGFSKDFKTTDVESAIAVKLTDAIPKHITNYQSTEGVTYSHRAHGYVTNLNVFREDLYRSFDQQTLVWTGFYTNNLDVSQTGGMFGGDTYIGSYALRYAQSAHVGTRRRMILSSVVESDYNLSWRHTGENFHEKYFPHASATDIFNLEDDSPDEEPPYYDNFYGYNIDYSAVSNIKSVEPFSKRREEVTNFPTRIARSAELDLSQSRDSFRIFLLEDYMDMPRERGELIKLSKLNNNIIPHFQRGIFRTKGREELQIDDFRAYVGSGDIFSVKPDELIPTETGFGGIANSKHALGTEYGYFFVDKQNKKVFLFSQNLEDLSSLKYGMHNFIKENLKSDSEISVGYDPFNKRLFITDHFNQWTLSYYPESEAWGSFHTYYPTDYFNTLNNAYCFYSGSQSQIFKMNSDIPDSNHPMVYEFVDNRNAEEGKIVSSLTLNTEVSADGFQIGNRTFDKVRVYNIHQNTGDIDIVNLVNARRIKNRWNINNLRHQETTPTEFTGYEWYFNRRLSDSFHIVRLTYLNSDIYSLYLYDAAINYREMLR